MGKGMLDWLARLLKGMLIGTGAILPGVSGGALAAVFGVYRRMIDFLADIRRDFWRNFSFFLPVGIGGLLGVFLLSHAVSRILENAEAQLLWFFVGCVTGTLPSLWREAGSQGRKPRHVLLAVATAIVAVLLLREGGSGTAPPPAVFRPAAWLLGGALVGLGAAVPGLSPSNFLIRLGMYKPMADGIRALDLAVILPLAGGAVMAVLLLSRLMSRVLARAHSAAHHAIFGMLCASTVVIIPLSASCAPAAVAVYAVNVSLGALLGWWMEKLGAPGKRA